MKQKKAEEAFKTILIVWAATFHTGIFSNTFRYTQQYSNIYLTTSQVNEPSEESMGMFSALGKQFNIPFSDKKLYERKSPNLNHIINNAKS